MAKSTGSLKKDISNALVRNSTGETDLDEYSEELSIAIKNIYGQGYAMGSVGPMYTTSNYTNTISTTEIINRIKDSNS